MMIIKPKVRGFICTTAHPKGCETHVMEWIHYITQQRSKSNILRNSKKIQKVLVIGASTGFGLASRISSAFGGGAETIGVFWERPAQGNRTASPGWYNTVAFEKAAHAQGLYAKSVNGDAFSDDIKKQTINLIKKDWGGAVDLVVYSIASPRRKHPKTGTVFNSVLKPIGTNYHSKTVDIMTGKVSKIKIEAASPEEVNNTIKVMGGEDWALWINALLDKQLLAHQSKTIAYSYLGPELTYPIYRQGTIGKAKEHLEVTTLKLKEQMKTACQGDALISVNKALVTQASAAIPVVPLYIALLFQIMKEKNLHEGCIQQIWRLFSERLYSDSDSSLKTDHCGRIRMDDWEMKTEVQSEITRLWKTINTDNLQEKTDIKGYRDDFYHLFGFNFNSIDYEQDVDINVNMASHR